MNPEVGCSLLVVVFLKVGPAVLVAIDCSCIRIFPHPVHLPNFHLWSAQARLFHGSGGKAEWCECWYCQCQGMRSAIWKSVLIMTHHISSQASCMPINSISSVAVHKGGIGSGAAFAGEKAAGDRRLNLIGCVKTANVHFVVR